nr:hypothetical protein [Tanacetum cinerariifolium]
MELMKASLIQTGLGLREKGIIKQNRRLTRYAYHVENTVAGDKTGVGVWLATDLSIVLGMLIWSIVMVSKAKECERFRNCYICVGWKRVGIIVVNQRRDAVLPAYEKLYKGSAEKHDTPLSGHSSHNKLLEDKRALLK